MRLLGESLSVPIKVYGPETHITEIVLLVLGVKTSERIHVPQSPLPSIYPWTEDCRLRAHHDWCNLIQWGSLIN